MKTTEVYSVILEALSGDTYNSRASNKLPELTFYQNNFERSSCLSKSIKQFSAYSYYCSLFFENMLIL